jgi:hypothetical protein
MRGVALLTGTVVLAASATGGAVVLTAAQHQAARRHHVLLVGTYDGVHGHYRSLQAAVDAARPGDWILVGPGDHKVHGSRAPKAAPQTPAGILVTTPDLYIRGMNRNKTIIDGTRSGPPCSLHRHDQVLGPKGKNGKHLGRNGIMVWKARNVWVQNLTACNFLGPGSSGGDTGNEIWWNGGDGTGKIGGHGYLGSYLTATNTYYHGEGTAAQYGIFSSNWNGGTWDRAYASNFNDSGFYIGACQRQCNQTVKHIWAEWNALGYSGSNSGGRLVVEYSQFDHNEDGFDTNSQNGDNPPPQNGACPGNAKSPITHTSSCWVFMHNYVHDNNDPNVPTAGSAAAGPVGTGISISGGRNDTVMDNRFVRNKAWGTIFVPYPDSGPPCTGGTETQAACIYDEYGDALLNNRYGHNGGYGNPTNGDFGAGNLESDPTDCFRGNTEIGGGQPTSSPPDAQTLYPTCNGQTVPPDSNGTFLDEVACDSGSIALAVASGGSLCPPGSNYPRQSKVVMHRLPGTHRRGGRPAIENPASARLKTMANPCHDVPTNPWCPKGSSSGTYRSLGTTTLATRTNADYSAWLAQPAEPRLHLEARTRRQ